MSVVMGHVIIPTYPAPHVPTAFAVPLQCCIDICHTNYESETEVTDYDAFTNDSTSCVDACPPEYDHRYPEDNQHGHRVHLLIYRADTQVSQLSRVLNPRWITVIIHWWVGRVGPRWGKTGRCNFRSRSQSFDTLYTALCFSCSFLRYLVHIKMPTLNTGCCGAPLFVLFRPRHRFTSCKRPPAK
jgi:hypothetical protein